MLGWEHHSPHSSVEPSVQHTLILQMAFPSFPKARNRTHLRQPIPKFRFRVFLHLWVLKDWFVFFLIWSMTKPISVLIQIYITPDLPITSVHWHHKTLGASTSFSCSCVWSSLAHTEIGAVLLWLNQPHELSCLCQLARGLSRALWVHVEIFSRK